jgi:hypothetical protein
MALMVVSDFMKNIPKPCEVSFIKMAFMKELLLQMVKQLIGLNQDLIVLCYSRGYR